MLRPYTRAFIRFLDMATMTRTPRRKLAPPRARANTPRRLRTTPSAKPVQDLWVGMDKHFYGRLASDSVILSDNTELPFTHTPDQHAEVRCRLGQMAAVHLAAEQNMRTFALRNARLIGFFDYSPDSPPDMEALKRLWADGSKAWAGIKDHVAWVRELRGD